MSIYYLFLGGRRSFKDPKCCSLLHGFAHVSKVGFVHPIFSLWDIIDVTLGLLPSLGHMIWRDSVSVWVQCQGSLRSKCFRASSSRELGREPKKISFFCSRSNFRSVTRLETLATQASVRAPKQSVQEFYSKASLFVARYLRATKVAKQLSTVTTPLCFWFFQCRVDVLRS